MCDLYVCGVCMCESVQKSFCLWVTFFFNLYFDDLLYLQIKQPDFKYVVTNSEQKKKYKEMIKQFLSVFNTAIIEKDIKGIEDFKEALSGVGCQLSNSIIFFCNNNVTVLFCNISKYTALVVLICILGGFCHSAKIGEKKKL